MVRRPESYIGVSGVVSNRQVRELRAKKEELETVGRRVNLGIKAVHKTQWLDIENKYGSMWYPVGNEISEILVTSSPLRNEMVTAQIFLDQHAADLEGIEDYPRKFVDRLIGRAGHFLTAIQFDMLPWAERDYTALLEHIRDRMPGAEILLQCYGGLMNDHSPAEVMQLFRPYHELTDHLLFDASHGTGSRLDVKRLEPFVDTASELPWLGVGIAGGLNSQVVVEELPELLSRFPHLSVDAEGQLHKNTPDLSLDMYATKQYIDEVVKLLKP